MISSAKASADSTPVSPCPLVLGTAAPVPAPHSHPPLYSMEGISSCQATERGHPAVLLVRPDWRATNSRHNQWVKT